MSEGHPDCLCRGRWRGVPIQHGFRTRTLGVPHPSGDPRIGIRSQSRRPVREQLDRISLGSVVQRRVNVGPGTQPESFRFARNFWFCSDKPSSSRPQLPTPEIGGTYGLDPGLIDPTKGDVRVREESRASGRGARLPNCRRDAILAAGQSDARQMRNCRRKASRNRRFVRTQFAGSPLNRPMATSIPNTPSTSEGSARISIDCETPKS